MYVFHMWYICVCVIIIHIVILYVDYYTYVAIYMYGFHMCYTFQIVINRGIYSF